MKHSAFPAVFLLLILAMPGCKSDEGEFAKVDAPVPVALTDAERARIDSFLKNVEAQEPALRGTYLRQHREEVEFIKSKNDVADFDRLRTYIGPSANATP